MIIDFHTHTFPDPIADAAIDRLSRQANITAYTCGTAAGLLLAERAAGVDRSIILPVATKPEQVHHINDYAAAHNKHAFVTNMFSFGCIHPDYEDWKQELDRLAAANMRGVKIHPAYQQTDLDDPKYLRILERAGTLGLIVVTHAGYDIGFPGCACCTPEKARSALRQVGPVKLVLAHMGGWRCWEQVPERALDGIEYLILPIAQADRVPREWRAKTLLELPRVMFGKLEEDTARRIAATQDAGFAGYEVSNIAHLRLCRGLTMSGSFGLNITNQLAAQFYADNGLGSMLILPEVKDSDISTIAPTHNGRPVPTGVLVYGHMPLMITRACPLQNIHDCAHCDKTGELTDRKAKKFPVRCGLGVRTIYNPVPIYMGDKPGALTVDYGVAYFTLESREEAAAILDSIRQHAPFEGEFTRGLYFKGTN